MVANAVLVGSPRGSHILHVSIRGSRPRRPLAGSTLARHPGKEPCRALHRQDLRADDYISQLPRRRRILRAAAEWRSQSPTSSSVAGARGGVCCCLRLRCGCDDVPTSSSARWGPWRSSPPPSWRPPPAKASPFSYIITLINSSRCVEHLATIDRMPPSSNPLSLEPHFYGVPAAMDVMPPWPHEMAPTCRISSGTWKKREEEWRKKEDADPTFFLLTWMWAP